MSQLIMPGRNRQGLPRPPPEISEAVEMYAREWGRTASLHFVPFGGWFARFELRPNDKRLKLYREGKVGEAPTEDVYFHVARQDYDPAVHPVIPGHEPRPDESPKRPFIPLDIYQMGVSGVKRFLQAGNTWGRGVYDSPEDALRKKEEANQRAKERDYKKKEDRAIQRSRDQRRQRLGIPFVRSGADVSDDGIDIDIIKPEGG